ncbi:family 20 glycosylhydrolase [Aliivibrio fischeri]|uniref:family 20 glycosylhydrolase n=1 Tax=Aliivibrio fischeri TaxID=668 RepID=UPI0012D86AEF|nr:family 20 glycosylhydrolase [Aliivibrio fischeri]MUK77180.1 family 20 glycosylhydrolase [Aliivibrio fischeri]
MKKTLLTLSISSFLFSASSLASAPNADLNLMPYPQSVELNSGQLEITSDFSIYIDGYKSERIQQLALRIIQRVEAQTGLPLLTPFASSKKEATLIIDVSKAAKNKIQDNNIDESYELTINKKQIILESDRPYGALRGAETFLQLINTSKAGYFVPQVNIEDEPRFPWRGASFDSSRHFVTVDTIKRQIDGFASAKMNVFHWHLWDDQAIRIQIESYPKLWEKTADGDFYTKEEIKDVVEYARLRGIRVIPEISLPGHASAVAHAYPELMSGEGEQSYDQQRAWGVFVPLMNPINPELYVFFDKVFSEVTELFPDEYIHIGGDEPNYQQWTDNKEIQAFIAENNIDGNRGLQSYLNARIEKMLNKKGKKIMGWDEIWHKDLPTSIVIQSWRGHDSIGRAAKEGYAGLLSTGFYLDQPQPTSYHYRNDPMPKGPQVDDQLHNGETFETYTWQKPRGKGGPRKGTLTIITDKNGDARAFTDYNGKSRAKVNIMEYTKGESFRGHFDNFMSYTEFNLIFNNGSINEESYQLVGNVRWPTTGEMTASSSIKNSEIPTPNGGYPVALNKDEEKLILGGEAAIWAENYDDLTVEGRIWPRTYAVAERLWSAEDLTDEDSMYQRLQAMDSWATISVGLQHQTNSYKQYLRIANGGDVSALMSFANYAEPAQYYARNWAKYNSTDPKGELYNQYERLNRFADAVPVESFAVLEMMKLAKTAINDQSDLKALQKHYQTVLESAQKSEVMFKNNVSSLDTVLLAQKHVEVAKATLAVINELEKGQQPTSTQLDNLLSITTNASGMYDEMIVAIVRPTEELVRQLRK